MNKIISKEFFLRNKITTPKFISIKKSFFSKARIESILKNKNMNYPIVSKPVNEGSSLGVAVK